MKYFRTKYGNIIDENNQYIPMDESSELYAGYLDYLKNDEEILSTDYVLDFENKPEVPQIVTNAQFRLALIESGQSISNINAFINSQDEPLKDVLNSLWEYANHFERQNPQLIGMAQLLGLTSEQLDDLFILANTK